MNTRDKVMGRAALFIVGAVSLGTEVISRSTNHVATVNGATLQNHVATPQRSHVAEQREAGK